MYRAGAGEGRQQRLMLGYKFINKCAHGKEGPWLNNIERVTVLRKLSDADIG
jgi:hypothetical protein